MEELLKIITGGGPYALAAVMAFLYWAERLERKELQAKITDLHSEFLERMINALNNAAQATRDAGVGIQTIITTLQNFMIQTRSRVNND